VREVKGVCSELTVGRFGGGDPGRTGESEGGRGEWSFGDIWHLESMIGRWWYVKKVDL
jgi:hypothetical protein